MTDRPVDRDQQFSSDNQWDASRQPEEQRTPEQTGSGLTPDVQQQYDESDNPNPDPDNDQYGNLEDSTDLSGNPEDQAMGQGVDSDSAAQDAFGDQNPISSENQPDMPEGEGIYDANDQKSRRDIVPPGSNKDQYNTRGSQDQYGNQQDIE